MKGSCALVASVIAASTMALSSSSSSSCDRNLNYNPCYNQEISSAEMGRTAETLGRKGSGEGEKFAPRFDGLRFIETLVTAHR